MGACLAEGALLCCCSCCGEVGNACKRLLGPQKVTKINYIFILLGFLIPIVLVTLLLSTFSKWVDLNPTQIISRISISLLCLFLFMLIFMLCRSRLSMVINESLFTIKYVFLIALFIASLFINKNFFDAYSSVAKYFSIIYMLLQSIILIDLAYIAGTYLAKRYSDGEQACGGVLIGFSIIFEGLAIFLNILGYIKFSADNCGSSLWSNALTSAILLLLPAIQLINLNPHNSLLTTSLISLYISYLAYSAQQSFGQGCLSRLTTSSYAIDAVVCVVIFIITTYGSIMGGLNDQTSFGEMSEAKDIETANEKLYTQSWGWVKWHYFMCLASLYLSMILSNWQSTELIGNNLQGNDFAFWIRITTALLTALMYAWSMIAPSIFPERDFETF